MKHTLKILTDELNMQTESARDLARYCEKIANSNNTVNLMFDKQLLDQHSTIKELTRAIKILEVVLD